MNESNVIVVDRIISDNLLYKIIDEIPSLVILYSEWSTTYQIMKRKYKKMESEFGNRIKFYYMSNRCCPEIRAEYGIMFFPACLFFREYKIIDIIEGAVSTTTLHNKLNKLVI